MYLHTGIAVVRYGSEGEMSLFLNTEYVGERMFGRRRRPCRLLSIRSFVRSFVRSKVRSFVPQFVRSFVPKFVRSFQSSFVRSFQSSFVRSFQSSFVPKFVRSSSLCVVAAAKPLVEGIIVVIVVIAVIVAIVVFANVLLEFAAFAVVDVVISPTRVC